MSPLIIGLVFVGVLMFIGLCLAIKYISVNIKCKTFFATHYHELTELEEKVNGVENYNVVVEENDGEVKFIRKIEKGNATKSYGIAVAKLAGLPNDIINRANEILIELEKRSKK